jgi:uncharacterized tellurite resistance protein B-like protein
MLLAKLKALLSDQPDNKPFSTNRPLELASAALMLEVGRADFSLQPAELDVIRDLLAHYFDLTSDEVSLLSEEAGERADAATCLFEFTRVVNDTASIEQKRELIGLMWRVAMADQTLSQYEEHVIRKVADLLYLPHSDFIRAKQAAL